MKANELRIGNWVKVKKTTSVDENIFVLNEFRLGTILISANQVEHIEPIPLTEEWLLKFGFEIYDNEQDYRVIFRKEHENSIYVFYISPKLDKNLPMCGAFGIYNDEFECEITGHKEEESTQYFAWKIAYVHQLQNLYFALTGEELKIK